MILLRWILLLQEFDLEIKDKRGNENVVADHLSRIEGIKPDHVPINDDFPYEHLIAQLELDSIIIEYHVTYEEKNTNKIMGVVCTTTILPWYVDFVNYLAARVLPPDVSYQRKKKFFHDLKHYYWEEPFLFKSGVGGIFHRCVPKNEIENIIVHYHEAPYG